MADKKGTLHYMVWHLFAKTVVFCYNSFWGFFCGEMVAYGQILHKNMPNWYHFGTKNRNYCNKA